MRYYNLLYFFIFCLSANGQTTDLLGDAYVGYSVVNSLGEEIISKNSHNLFTPASTIKVVTSWLTLKEYGDNYRFKTSIGYRGYIDEGGTLVGDVIIKSAGDPTLGSKRNNENGSTYQWINNIKTQLNNVGITCVDGEIIIDDSFFQGQNVSPKWTYEDLGNYYGAGAWSTNIDENRIKITFKASSLANTQTKIKEIRPNLPQLKFKNYVKTNIVGGKDEAYVFGVPMQNVRTIRGSIPVTSKDFTIKGSLPNPPYNLGQMIRAQLSDLFPYNRISVTKKEIKNFTIIKSYYSKPLIELVKACNFHSINIYADTFLRLLGKKRCGDGTIECGIQYITQKIKNIKLFDGCGLSPFNQITPYELAHFIIKNIKENPKLEETLGQVGKDGTVKYFLKNSSFANNMKLKSGSFEGVLNYTGTIKKNNKKYGISIMVNHGNLSYSELKKEIEKIVTYIYSKSM